MGYLATSNLSVKSILDMLGVVTPKDIFYNGSTLRTSTELATVVNKLWLGDACPGATPDAKLSSLYTDRKLSYFKGYGFFNNVTFSTSYGVSGDISTIWPDPLELSCGSNSSAETYLQSFATSTITISLNGVIATPQLYLDVYIDNVIQSPLRRSLTFPSCTVYVNLPSAMSYPHTLRFSISS